MSYLSISPLDRAPGRVTDMWQIRSMGGSVLGVIEWWSPWRRYVFEPSENTLYDVACLREIARFIEDAMASRKRDRAERAG